MQKNIIMATKAKAKSKIKKWASSHSLHNPKTKLPFRLSVKMHEDVVDFVHGMFIGLLIGLVTGLFLKNFL